MTSLQELGVSKQPFAQDDQQQMQGLIDLCTHLLAAVAAAGAAAATPLLAAGLLPGLWLSTHCSNRLSQCLLRSLLEAQQLERLHSLSQQVTAARQQALLPGVEHSVPDGLH